METFDFSDYELVKGKYEELEEDYEEVYATNYGYLAWLDCC